MAQDASPGDAPVPVGELALTGSHQDDVVDLIFNAEGVLGGGLVLGARIRAHVRMLEPHLSCQAVHGVKGQDLLQKVNGCREKEAKAIQVTCCSCHAEKGPQRGDSPRRL